MKAGLHLVLPIAGAIVGYAAWSGPFIMLPTALLLPALWVAAEGRIASGVVVLSYQLTATHGAPAGIARYYGTVFAAGVALWLAAAAIVGAAWLVLWRHSRVERIVVVPIALALVALPPVGVVGWVSPLTSAGAVFPSLGWIGLIAVLALAMAISALPLRTAASCAVVLVAWTGWIASPPGCPDRWVGIDTRHDFGSGADPLREYERQVALLSVVLASTAHTIVLPESAGGAWTRANAGLWASGLAGQPDRTVLLGGEVYEAHGKPSNAVIAVTSRGDEIVYRQRMPIVGSMWQPWSRKGVQAHWFGNPTVSVGGIRTAFLLCNEQALVWPVIHSMLAEPQLLVGCANGWWCAGTNLPAIQENSLRAWACLFDLPCVHATNR